MDLPIEKLFNSKYKILNEQAYTADGILIYNLKGYTKNTKNILEEISKYFQNYGRNVKVSLLRKHNYLIEFTDSKEAANVLRKCQLLISNYILYVEPCSSLLQPYIKNFIKYLEPSFDNDNYLTNSVDKVSLISKLNDDCLMEICKNFNIQDEINFALCCQRFCHIIQTISCFKYTNFNMEVLQALTCFQIKIFGSIVGPYIKSLTYYDTRFAKLFCTYCKNIETLKIECLMLEKCLLKFFDVHMPEIRKLEIKAIVWDGNEIRHLKLYENLQSLNINSRVTTGKYISSLNQLTELSLKDCSNLEPEYFQDICKNLKNLKYLDIRNCWRLTSKNFEQILENLILLEILKFTNTKENFVCITRLPQLKCLKINSEKYKELSTDFFEELAKYQASQLLELKTDNIKLNLQEISLISGLENIKVLHCCRNDTLNDECLEKLSVLTKLQDIHLNNCSCISNVGILKLLENCLELKKLNVVGCPLVSSDLVRCAVKLLHDQHVKYLRMNRIHIIVEDTEEFRNEVDELDKQIYNDILKVTFEKYQRYENLRSGGILIPMSTFPMCRTFCGFGRDRELNSNPWDDELYLDWD